MGWGTKESVKVCVCVCVGWGFTVWVGGWGAMREWSGGVGVKGGPSDGWSWGSGARRQFARDSRGGKFRPFRAARDLDCMHAEREL